MNGQDPELSRVSRKKGRNRKDNILNILIGVVVILIVITASIIFAGNNDGEQVSDKGAVTEENRPNDNDDKSDPKDKGQEGPVVDEDEDVSVKDDEPITDSTADEDSTTESETVTSSPSDDAAVAETLVDSSWQPIGTTQTGNHVSLYDGTSVDWNEKKQALAYATGLPEDTMIFWKIKNGGDPQKSIGIVSSQDTTEKYRVYLEWVDGEGWKPTKMDVLTTLEGQK